MSPLTHLARSLFTMDGPYTEAPRQKSLPKRQLRRLTKSHFIELPRSALGGHSKSRSMASPATARHLLGREGSTRRPMLGIPRRFYHFVFGVIQSGLTCAIAAAIASYPSMAHGLFMERWIRAWLLSWLLMVPIVVLAAPAIRRMANMLTRDDSSVRS
jgi:hypothetical protein